MDFAVVIEGTVLPGFDASVATVQLARLTKQSQAVAARLLGGKQSVVKRGLDHATAMRYVAALRQIGVAAHVEEETLEIDVEAPEPSGGPPKAVAAVAAVTVHQPVMTPPPTDGEAASPPVKKKSIRWKVIAAVVVVLWIFGYAIRPTTRPDTPPTASRAMQTTAAPVSAKKDSELEELCQNFVFFKAKAYKHGREGNESARVDAHRNMQQAARWLEAYPESEVARVCAKFDTEENLAKYMR